MIKDLFLFDDNVDVVKNAIGNIFIIDNIDLFD